jgi:hypothetical protein
MAEVNRTSAWLRSQPLAANVGRHCLPQGAESPGITPTREIHDGLLRAGMMPQNGSFDETQPTSCVPYAMPSFSP